MASRRIIQDSDDDGDGTGSLGNSPAKTDGAFQPSTIETFATTSMIQTSSTDPVLFSAIYETHLGTNLENSHQLPYHEQSSIFESFIHDPHMSSSDNGSRKIKRSKTTHLSSLTSVSEPKTSNRKAKCTQAIREVDELTQITTPKASEETKERDIWAFLSSSASNESSELNASLKGRKNVPLKTYGRPIRRSQTMVYATSSLPNESTIADIADRDIGHTTNVKRQLEIHDEGDLPIISVNIKRLKQDTSSYEELIDDTAATSTNYDNMDGPSFATDPASVNARLPTSEMPQNASQNFPKYQSVGINVQFPGTADTTAKSDIISAFTDHQNPPESNRSIVIIPNSLTEAQKSQYQLVSVNSSIGSRRPSQPEMVDIVDTKSELTEGTSTLPVDNLLPNVLLATTGLSASIILSSPPQSSPPISTANLKMKGAVSEAALKEVASPVTLKSPHKTTKSIKRRNTFTPGEEQFWRESSVDELSLAPQPRSETITATKVGTRKEKKRDHLRDRKDQVSVDELLGSDEIGNPEEHYQPRPSLRRSKSMSIQSENKTVINDQGRSKRRRRKTDKITGNQFGSITTDVKTLEGADTEIDAILIDPTFLGFDAGGLEGHCHTGKSDEPANLQNITDTSKVGEAFVVVPKAVPQLKRRGRLRKKTSESVANGPENISEMQQRELNTGVSHTSDKESVVLKEISHNESPPRRPTSTPSTLQISSVNEIDVGNPPSKSKEIADSPSRQTPKREAKKGPDQHSPLQSGRIAYRVGLSKKTRIAPLLKVIKKS